jgi:hypothetical protein
VAPKNSQLFSGPVAKSDPRPKAPVKLYVLAISKDIALIDLVLEVGDPQTYALLHCSVFKERTQAGLGGSHADLNDRGCARQLESRRLSYRRAPDVSRNGTNFLDGSRRALRLTRAGPKKFHRAPAAPSAERAFARPPVRRRFRSCATSILPARKAAGSRGRRPCYPCPTC